MLRLPSRLLVAIAAAGGLGWPGRATAEPLELELPTTRRVARAGATLVSDDGAGALLLAPAGLARQSGRRAELDLVVHDGESSFRAIDADASPTIEDRSGAGVSPAALVALGFGRLVVAAGYAESADADTALPAPEPGQPAADVARLFPHRYAGIAASLELRTFMLGGAVRLGDAVALGAALHASDATMTERRTLWAGFAGRDPVGDPSRDLLLSLDARDRFVLGGALSVLVAPPELPVELGLAVSVRDTILGRGAAGLVASHGDAAPSAVLDAPRARLEIARHVRIAAGARYLGERFAVELAVELADLGDSGSTPGGSPTELAGARWAIDGVSVLDDSGQVAEVAGAPAFSQHRTRGAARGALDVEVAPGFLWLVAGYALTTTDGPVSPHATELGHHTFAVGAEASWDDLTIALGYARSLSRARTTPQGGTLLNPFAGPGAEPVAVGAGTYDASTDTLGLAIRIGWP